jgi:PAS domain S-box-containing protein
MDVNFSVLTHFIQQTANELDENKKLLEQYKMIVDHSLIISKTDTQGNITYANDAFCKTSKYSKEELIGRNHNIIRDPNIPKHIFKNMWDTILSGKIWQGTISNKAKDGTIYYVDATIMPIKKGDEIVEFIALRFNVTSKVNSKKRLLEKEKLMRALLNNQESMILYLSENKQLINANKYFLEQFGYKNIIECKKEFSDISKLFLDDEDEEYIYASKYPNWIDDIADKKIDFIPKVKIKINDNIHIFRLRIAKVNNQYIVNLDDITDLENAIKKAYASEKAKSIFLANMSHEIRTPLNAIIGFISILKTKKFDKTTNKYIGIIDRSSKTLLNIVNDILDFSKIESGKVSISPVKTECIPELRDAILAFSFVCKQKNIKYNINIDKNIPAVLYCDIQRIKQVLNNLIGNAVKFTPENGEIKVLIKLKEIKDNKAHIHFSVKDTGIGIPKDKINTIFTPFTQADNSISRKFGGTGLGLAISQEYIKLMGSKIKIKSKENEGSEFYFDLEIPIIKQNVENKEEKNENKHFNAKVLVAEDEPTNQLLISVLLKERGIKYKMVNNGKEAIDLALKEDFDIVFMDIKMPILDGLSAIKILKEKGYKKPIVSLSANVLEEDKNEIIQSGAVDTLNKPIVPKELDNILEKYVKQSKKSVVSKAMNNFNNMKDNVKQTIKDHLPHKDKVEEFEYDDISIENIAKELNIKDKNLVIHLLKSFRNSIDKQMKAIENNGLNKDLLHTIKGLTGNLRLKNMYNLTSKLEQEIDNWDKSEYNSNSKTVYEHLKNILTQINNKIGGK